MTTFRKAATRTLAFVAVTAIFYALLWLIFNDVDSLADRERLAENDAAQSAVIEQLQNDLATEQATSMALGDQLARLGVQPEVEPSPTVVNESTPLSLLQTLIDAGLNARCGGTSCVGPPGAPGASVTGAKGDPGETVVGPPGPPGETVVGPAGRGVSNVSCEADGTWVIAYTDGTTSTTPGPCRAVSDPPTDPPMEEP